MKKEQLNLNDRICIQACIEKHYGLARTAKFVHKNKSTVYREIKNNCRVVEAFRGCSHCAYTCDERLKDCKKFTPSHCKKWKKFPYTCNHCNISSICHHEKHYYDCVEADEKSFKNKSETRSNTIITNEELKIINSITARCIKEKGQSLHHCYISNKELQNICSEITIRRYIYKGYLDTKAHNLPRFVRYKKQYAYPRQKIVNAERMLGRTFTDYCNYVNKHQNCNIWQYDSVLGKLSDKKSILTITYPKTRFQFGILLENNHKADQVLRTMRFLQSKLGERFKEIFEVNLSDNGVEFNLFHEAEYDKNGVFQCKIFFTNPYKSTDKAECERNHEFIRYDIPKGISLDNLTQEKVNLLFSHINSYIRESNKNKTPFELTKESFGPEFLELLGIKEIPLQDVCLKRQLLI